jgi:antitoxin component of RelBE/YafQ-DinJ toxin-antitoxin module
MVKTLTYIFKLYIIYRELDSRLHGNDRGFSYLIFKNKRMTSQVIFKVDKKLKDKAMKKARQQGIPLASVLKTMMQKYAEDSFDVRLEVRPRLNAKTRRELEKISKDIDEGKNLVGPFKNVEEMKKYLEA